VHLPAHGAGQKKRAGLKENRTEKKTGQIKKTSRAGKKNKPNNTGEPKANRKPYPVFLSVLFLFCPVGNRAIRCFSFFCPVFK
jgi:hypothetical protein